MRFRATTLAVLFPLALASLAPAAAAAAPAAQSSAEQRFDHISVTTVGSGKPVVVIPGMSTPREVWDGIVPALAASHRVVLVQVNGFAGDDPGANAKSGMLDGVVADIQTYLEKNKLGRARVIGHSMGGLVGLKLALAHPGSVDRLMVVDALPFFGTVMADDATVESMRPIAETMRSRMLGAAAAMKARAASPVTSDPGGDMSMTAEGRIRIANWSMKANAAVVGQAVYEDMLTDLRKDIARIEAPMTVLYHSGGDPTGINRKVYERDYEAQPKTTLIAIPDAGHFIMLDQPKRFAEEVKSFLR